MVWSGVACDPARNCAARNCLLTYGPPCQGILRTIALSGAPDGGFDASELLRLALDSAGTAGSGAAGDPLVADCAALVVEVRTP